MTHQLTPLRYPSRRDLLRLGAGAAAAIGMPWPALAQSAPELSHGFSPLGELAYAPNFTHFAYRNPAAPKGGRLRLARMGAFDTTDTLRYPGRPPADIRLIFDRLFTASADEAASHYGHLAKGFLVADDLASVRVQLHQDARWHDGRPLTAEDVIFTFETLKNGGAPFYRQAYAPFGILVENERELVFVNEGGPDRDIVGKLATLPIHAAHADGTADPLGSGPYRVAEIGAPDRLVLERVADYWGRDLPTQSGAFNFDRLEFSYFRDRDVALEAFRADEYDSRTETDPGRWRTGYDGLENQTPPVQRAEISTRTAGTIHGLVINTLSGRLGDRRVRLALRLMIDAEPLIDGLLGGVFEPFQGPFDGSTLAASGAAGPGERALLAGAEAAMLEDADPLSDLPPPGSREAAALASRLLDEAGLFLDGTVRRDPATGAPVRLRSVSTSPAYDGAIGAIALSFERIGIGLDNQNLEPVTAGRALLDRDFDLATLSWTPSLLPGTAERLLWHGDLAARPGSYALSGLTDPVMDRALDAMLAARSRDEVEAAARAFDRVFRHAMTFLPLWRDGMVRLAWRDRVLGPEDPEGRLSENVLTDWWAGSAS